MSPVGYILVATSVWGALYLGVNSVIGLVEENSELKIEVMQGRIDCERKLYEQDINTDKREAEQSLSSIYDTSISVDGNYSL